MKPTSNTEGRAPSRDLRAPARTAIRCGVVVALLAMPVTVGQARADRAGPLASGAQSSLAPVTFSSTGAEQTYTVPEGVASLQVQAVGANGGGTNLVSGDRVLGGTGGLVTGQIAVGSGSAIAPGDTLYVEVGGNPTDTQGGFNGGGNAPFTVDGNNGGGATDLRTCARASTSCANGVPSPLTRLIVAGGGGGAGGCGSDDSGDDCSWGLSGAGGSAGQPGGNARSAETSAAGGAGTLAGPGGPGAPPGRFEVAATAGGADGSGGDGGGVVSGPNHGPPVVGGGAGGGYYGGGGGGLSDVTLNGSTYALGTGGGGGGANFASPLAVSGASFDSGDGTPRLVITPRPPSAIRISRISHDSPGPDTGGNKSLNAEFVRLTNQGPTARQLSGWSMSDSDGNVYRFGQLRLRPGTSVTVHSGRGRDTARHRYWSRRSYVWHNTRETVRVRSARGRLADQCRYDNAGGGQMDC